MLKIVTKKQTHVIEYEGAKFTVVVNTKEENQAIVDKHEYVKKIKTGPGQKDQYEPAWNWLEIQAENLDTQITGWEGVADKLECNTENKRQLAMNRENDHVCLHIIQEIADIGKTAEIVKEVKVKNS
jgi:hypothetical protein